jgi:hypothetical protein
VNHTQLGLQTTDAIDAICMFAPPSVNGVLFSLAPGSPTLASSGFSAADVLRAGPTLAFSASQFGLLSSDDMDGLKCRASADAAAASLTAPASRQTSAQTGSAPSIPTPTVSPTPTRSALPARN